MSESEKPLEIQIAELKARIQANDLAMIIAEEHNDQTESHRIDEETHALTIQLAKLKGEKITREFPKEATYDP